MWAASAPAIAERTLVQQVPIGEQNRIELGISLDPSGVLGHDIRPVQEVCDAAEALCLTLCAEIASALVQPFKRCILLGNNVQGVSPKHDTGQVSIGLSLARTEGVILPVV